MSMAEFVMPEVEVGQDVWWYAQGDLGQPPCAAKVTGVGQGSLCLSIFQPASYNLAIRDGVRHVTDPRRRDSPDVLESGLWDYTDRDKKRVEMERRIQALQKSLGK
jgi:hypothetical protein